MPLRFPTFVTAIAELADVPAVVRVLEQGAALMVERQGLGWDASEIGAAVVSASVRAGEFIVARTDEDILGACTLTRADPDYWPEDEVGVAAYVHRLAVGRKFAGGQVSGRLIARCESLAADWGCAFLRLDCDPSIRFVYERVGFAYVDTKTVELDGKDAVVDRLQRPVANIVTLR